MPISNPINNLTPGANISNVTDPLLLTGTTLSVKDATDVQKGVSRLQIDINDVISTTTGVTPKYVKDLIDKTILSPNQLANAFIATTTNIALTGSVTYNGIVIPTGSRVIVAGQTLTQNNGIYLSDDAGTWARTTDADTIDKLYLSQTIALNGDNGLYLCTVGSTAILGTDPILFIKLYQTNDELIGVQLYNSAVIYNLDSLVVQPSVDQYIYRCLTNGTVNVAPSMAATNWEIYQGLLYTNSAIVAPNGDDLKSIGFPYLTYTGAILDLGINTYIDGRTVVNSETVTPKAGMMVRGNKAQTNNLILNVNDVIVDGMYFANTIGIANPIEINAVTNSTFRNVKADKVGGAQSISVTGAWSGVHTFDNIQLTGNINIVGTTTTGQIYFNNCNSTLILTLNCVNATVYISNCPNFTLIQTAGTIIDLSSSSTGDTKTSLQTADHRKWLLWTNGRSLSRTTYPTLWNFVNSNSLVAAGLFGAGDGTTTFTLGNLNGRAIGIAGSGTGLTARAVGASVGTETQTLTVANLPSHSHSIFGDGASGIGSGGSADRVLVNTDGPTQDVYVKETALTGSGTAFNIMQPTIFLNLFVFSG